MSESESFDMEGESSFGDDGGNSSHDGGDCESLNNNTGELHRCEVITTRAMLQCGHQPINGH